MYRGGQHILKKLGIKRKACVGSGPTYYCAETFTSV